jgi:hypothetical protein
MDDAERGRRDVPREWFYVAKDIVWSSFVINEFHRTGRDIRREIYPPYTPFTDV